MDPAFVAAAFNDWRDAGVVLQSRSVWETLLAGMKTRGYSVKFTGENRA